MTYKFAYRRRIFWKTVEVAGHGVVTRIVRDANGQRVPMGFGKDGQPLRNENGEVLYQTEYDDRQDKMVLYFPDGSIREIKEWSKCEVRLGIDWVLFTKKRIEKAIGQPIELNIGG